jgi:hypothetical protein
MSVNAESDRAIGAAQSLAGIYSRPIKDPIQDSFPTGIHGLDRDQINMSKSWSVMPNQVESA